MTYANVSWDSWQFFLQEMYSIKANEVISNHDQSKPLFLYLAMQHIHTPIQSNDTYLDKFDGVRVKNDFLLTIT